MVQQVKNLPAMQETQDTQIRSLGQEDPLEEDMASHFSVLAWEIPWQRSLGGYRPWGHQVLDTTEAAEHSTQQGQHRVLIIVNIFKHH